MAWMGLLGHMSGWINDFLKKMNRMWVSQDFIRTFLIDGFFESAWVINFMRIDVIAFFIIIILQDLFVIFLLRIMINDACEQVKNAQKKP